MFTIVLLTTWAATQWVTWQVGFQAQLGEPWFVVAGRPIYHPPAFFWWWYFYDAYAPIRSPFEIGFHCRTSRQWHPGLISRMITG